MGANHPVLAGTTHAPCHWDLWTDNVIVAPDGAWWTPDWDDLSIGDEAEDLATLIWPFAVDQGQDWHDLLGTHRNEAFSERLDLHLRAISLDYAIDVVADWVDYAGTEWRDVVRPKKQALHLRNLESYRKRWG